MRDLADLLDGSADAGTKYAMRWIPPERPRCPVCDTQTDQHSTYAHQTEPQEAHHG